MTSHKTLDMPLIPLFHFISRRMLESILAGACYYGYITHGHSHIGAIMALR